MSAPLSKDDQRLAAAVRGFGCPGIVSLRTKRTDLPEQIPYLDLLSPLVRKEVAHLPDAVAEFQGRPVMYLLDAAAGELPPATRLDLQQRLANRGDHAVLAVVRPGEVVLYPLNLDRKQLNEHGLGEVVKITDPRAPLLFDSVATGAWSVPGRSEDADPVFEEIKKLLQRAVEDLVTGAGLNGLDVLSMTGRALFFRFLIDRGIVEEALLPKICPVALKGPKPHDLKAVFSTAERAAQTSAWLDDTFNGDLLPLVDGLTPATPTAARTRAYREIYKEAGEKSGGEIFRHMEAILRGWEHVSGVTQPLLIDWHDLNFRHIPIGVLSQVYENFSHQVDHEDSTDRSVHYTPRLLARLLVDQAMAGLDTPAHEARILDPACGAGVFLVLALRELVRRRWEHDRERFGDKARRPGKRVIESILHGQIRGFDVSESALRLAALGLYITVIELNEITTPPSEHHASRALQGLVLFDQRTPEERARRGFVNGSLGKAVDRAEFDGAFDVVLGNPPWSRVDGPEKEPLDAVGTATARRVLESRGLTELVKDYAHPGGVPDVPFLWKAAEWAKPAGIIAYALEARLILAQSGPAIKARNALLQAISVTGILNGSDLEKTAVWGCHDQPWILLWARNQKPDLAEQMFHLLTPVRENELARRGEFRLDYQSAYQIPVRQVIERPWLCKALAIGTMLDVEVMDKLTKAAQQQSVGTFWDENKLWSTRGLDIRPFKNRAAPEWLLDLAVFDGEEPGLFEEEQHLTYRQRHGSQEPNNTRQRENYSAPITVIRRAPGETRMVIKSHRLLHDIGFTKNYFGYSAKGFAEANLLVGLLHLIAHSSLFQHFSYMRSAQMGAKRRILDKQDIDAFPFPVLDDLSAETRTRALELAKMLDAPGPKEWEALDGFVCGLFGLTKAEQQVVADTVAFNGPYASVREPAALPVPPKEAETFAASLQQSLRPFFNAAGQKAQARPVPRLEGEWRQPWAFVTLLPEGDEWTTSPKLIASVMAEASACAASRVVMPLPEGGLILGLINKRRFWTRSRARLCALHIAHEHLEKCFPLPRR